MRPDNIYKKVPAPEESEPMDPVPQSLPQEIQQWGTPLAVRRARSFLLLIELLAGGFLFLLCLVPALFAVTITVAGLFKGEMAAFGMGLLILGFLGRSPLLPGRSCSGPGRDLAFAFLSFRKESFIRADAGLSFIAGQTSSLSPIMPSTA